jgi:hypothetical protein
MYISLQERHASYPWLFRWCGRAGGLILVVAWLALVIAELARSDVEPPATRAYFQAAALMIVFAGYALGWRKELAGGMLVILGTVAFFAVHMMAFNVWPQLGAAWFAAPGVLYLLSWIFSNRGHELRAQT